MTPTSPARNSRQPLSPARGIFLGSVAAGALVAAATGFGLTELAPWTAPAHAAPAAGTATGTAGFADLIAKVEPAVVSVQVQMQPQGVSLRGQPSNRTAMAEGAGFFISGDGYIVTANHVVDGAKSIRITTDDGVTYPAKVIGVDGTTDVALLKVDASHEFTYVKFADQMPRVGDWVVAIGTPFGLDKTATVGIVSALARDIGGRSTGGYLQIDAAINQGNSGGPTFDVHGNVVGINDQIFSPSGGSVGIGFDVPADVAKTVVAELQKSGHVSRAWLGVAVQTLTEDLAAGLGLKSDAVGALVADPQANGPAAGAGIVAGDLITAVNGSPVKDARSLSQAIAALAPGASAKIDMLTHGQAKTVNVTLGEQPAPKT
jgi:serine protease Do